MDDQHSPPRHAHGRPHRRWRVRRLLLGLLVCLLVWGSSPVSARAATPRHYTELELPPLPEVRVPNYSRFQLSNGLTVYLMEDHEWPLVSGTALIRTGDRWEAADRVGLADLTGDLMRAGGTQRHPIDTLNQMLEQRAAVVETGIGTTSGSASFRSLKEDLPLVFQLFAEVLQQPAFVTDKLELLKNQQRGGIARRNDDPNSIAGREFYKLIYGSDSPYARTVEYTTLDRITRADVVDFYRRYVRPDQMILGIVGDFEPAAMRALISREFGNWKAATPPPATTLPAVRQAQPGGLFMVNQPQLSQSYVQIGQLGGKMSDPDTFALFVMNGVMNGFGGRLVNQVRSREGLAYSVYASWSPQFDYPGVFVAGGQTRSATTVPFIRSVLEQLKQLRSTPITAAELDYARDSILNSFVFNFQDPAQTLSRLMRYEYFGYPSDFIFRYQRGVKATTAADVQRVAQTYLKPEQLVTLVVGNPVAIQPPLTTLQPNVQAIDITIPQPRS